MSYLRSVNRSSGVRTWNFQFKFWACSLSSFIRVKFIGPFLDLILFFRSFLPGRRSTGCIGSVVPILCRMVCLATCVTWLINSFWLSLVSVTVFVVVVMIVNVAVRLFVTRSISIISSLFSLFFQQSILVSVCCGFLQWWHVGLCLSAFAFSVLWLTVFICSSLGASKPFSSNSFFWHAHMCHFPSGPDSLISSGVVAFWRISIVE